VVDELLLQLDERFFVLFKCLDITNLVTQQRTSKSLAFDSNLFLMASALDPRFAFLWMIDHPGPLEVKDRLRHQITGKYQLMGENSRLVVTSNK
jgi:hypothetical protein